MSGSRVPTGIPSSLLSSCISLLSDLPRSLGLSPTTIFFIPSLPLLSYILLAKRLCLPLLGAVVLGAVLGVLLSILLGVLGVLLGVLGLAVPGVGVVGLGALGVVILCVILVVRLDL